MTLAINRSSIALLLIVSIGLCACGSGEGEAATPEKPTTDAGKVQEQAEGMAQAEAGDSAVAAQHAATKMAALAKAGDWKTLIKDYYGEADKIPGDQQLNMLVDRFKDGWGDEITPLLEQASTIKPVIEEGKAKFQVDGQTIYELHLGDDGEWGFHL